MLTTMKETLDHVKKGGCGVTAPNAQNGGTAKAVLEVVEEYRALMIVDVDAFVRTDLPWFIHMIRDLAEKVSVPVATNLDHGKSCEDIIPSINPRFTSIMVDRSSLSYEGNVEQTKEVVKICKPLGISVEAELGHVGMGNNYAVDGVDNLTVPNEAADFIKEAGVDCLAAAVGTAHGRYTRIPHIDFERLKQLVEACGNTPLALHDGGGMGDENLRKVVQSGIQKANLATELIVAGKKKLESFIKGPNFNRWKLIPAFKKGCKDRLAHYAELFDQAGRA